MLGNKISLILAIIIVVIFAILWNRGSQQIETPIVPVVSTTPKVEVVQTVIKSSGSSDSALDQDASIIDKELNSLNTDSANLDQSLNDKPVLQ